MDYMLFLTIHGELNKVLDLCTHTLVDLKVMVKGKVRAIKLLPFVPCDGLRISRWQQNNVVLNPRVLLHFGQYVHCLDGVFLL